MSSVQPLKQIKLLLRMIYSKEVRDEIFPALMNLMQRYGNSEAIRERRRRYGDRVLLSEKDVILITYADTLYKEGERPLQTLHRFLEERVGNSVSGVHILPFFPSSSDGGYAVVNYKEVDPRLGTWEDIREIARGHRLMVDLVINHVSSRSKWFRKFLEGDKRYRDYFIWSDNEPYLPEVFRPRETPLFTRFQTAMGEKYVWTTFSADQIDLNFRNPRVLLSMIDVLFFYLSQGAEIIRLDAIGYIWKERGTSCVNLGKTHQIVRLLRSVLEYTAPYAVIVTEANFPYRDNISYFGEGNEAHMVYMFCLPPLVVDAFARRDTSYIRRITNRKRMDLLFFDFLASHDGIGLSSAREILKPEHFENLLRLTESRGGFISYNIRQGERVPYELNISYFDAISDPRRTDDPYAVKRFIASQAIMLAIKGVPGIYIHSLLGSRNYLQGVKETGIKRMINREKLPCEAVEAALDDPRSLRHQVFTAYRKLLAVRRDIPAFNPNGTRQVLPSDRRLLVIARRYRNDQVDAVINVSEEEVPLPEYAGRPDALSQAPFPGKAEPYGVYFLRYGS